MYKDMHIQLLFFSSNILSECFHKSGNSRSVIHMGEYGKTVYLYLNDFICMCLTYQFCLVYAPVICIPGSLGAGDSGDIEGSKCRDLTFDESRQCRSCAGVLNSRQNTNLCHILTTRGMLSLYICSLISSCCVA